MLHRMWGIGTSSPATCTNGNLAVYTAASNTEIAAVTGGANYCTFSLRNNSIRYSMQIRTDQSNAWTLRDETAGANRLLVDTSGNLQFNSGYGSAATAYGCRAWVNFNGTGTPAIRGSGNVSSITDNGTGDYTVNFTTAMPDINYCSLATGTGQEGVSIDGYVNFRDTVTNKLVGSVRVQEVLQSGSPYDTPNMNVAIFR
jgi:hypothetical protein